MITRTLAEARSLLQTVASGAGLNITDARLTEAINYVTEVYVNEGHWPGVIQRIRFCNYSGCVVLPEGYEVALRFLVQCSAPPIASMWYEFMPHGPGRQDGDHAWAGVPIDRGETPVVRQADTEDTDGGQILRCYSLVDERVDSVAPTIRVLAKDVNGRFIRSFESGSWVDGFTMALNGHLPTNYVDSAVKLSEVLGIIAPRTNKGYELFWVDSDAETHFAGRYSYKGGQPMFRRYWCPGVAADDEFISIHALCRRRYTPAVDDSDLLYISNLRALRMGILAKAQEETPGGNPDPLWAMGLASLQAEARAWYGDQIPSIQMAPYTGFAETHPLS